MQTTSGNPAEGKVIFKIGSDATATVTNNPLTATTLHFSVTNKDGTVVTDWLLKLRDNCNGGAGALLGLWVNNRFFQYEVTG